MKLNNIYTTFNGEVNNKGIGSPVIFLRLQGCHLRCYLKTLGVLCDTPEGLKKPEEMDNIRGIYEEVKSLSDGTGIKLITLTGGDPLYNKQEELEELFDLLIYEGKFEINVETSGTLSWLPYAYYPKLHWVIDYKGKSAGVKLKNLVLDREHLGTLDKDDYIKFVIYDDADFEECVESVEFIRGTGSKVNIAVGCYWGGKIEPLELFEKLKERKMLNKVTMNFQVHKMAVSSVYNKEIPKDI